jgi:zinc/manganese transport system substrate-binding protein
MKRLFLLITLGLLAMPALAALNVFATVPEWGALVKVIGGDQVAVYTATTARQDPHRIEARPSLLARARQAQLVVATGADLEAGWLPLVQRDSGNAAIQVGRPGYFEAAAFVSLLDVPKAVDRTLGDVHAAGNPHLHLDPRNLLKVGEALATRMGQLDPPGAASYRTAWESFAGQWRTAVARWEQTAAPLKEVRVLTHHESFAYLVRWLGMRETGTLEPKPGIEPTSGHLSSLLARQQAAPAAMVLRTPYDAAAPSDWLAGKGGIAAVLLPYTVGGTPEASDLFGLFDDTLRRLLKAVR